MNATARDLVELMIAVPEEASRRRSSPIRPEALLKAFPEVRADLAEQDEIGAKTKAAAPPIGNLSPSGTTAARSSTAGESVRYTGRTRALKLYASNLISTQYP